MALTLGAIAISCCICSPPAVAQPHTIVRPIEIPFASAEPIVLLRFHACGFLDRRATGLAVVDADDQPTPFEILKHNPAGETVLAVDARDMQLPLALHYGDKPLPRLTRREQVPISLVLRTFALPDRQQPPQPAAVRALLSSPRADGVMFVDRIFQGHNPFGPNEHYIAEFRGLLDSPDDQTLRMFTIASHQSRVSIDGHTALQSSETNITRDSERIAEEARPIKLPAGRHALRYQHFQATGRPVAVLGHINPSDAAVPLDTHQFVHHQEATLGPPVARHTSTPLAFDVQPVDHLSDDGRLFSRFALQPITSPPDGHFYRWQFSDGTQSGSPNPDPPHATEHVFISPPNKFATWRVTLELLDKHDRIVRQASTTIRPVLHASPHGISDTEKLKQFARVIGQADYTHARADLLITLYHLIKHTEQTDLIAPIAQLVYQDVRSRDPALAADMLYIVAEHLSEHDPQRALELFQQLAESRRDPWRAACAAAQMLDLMIFQLDQADRVNARIRDLVKNRSARAQTLLRVRLGDTHRVAGRIDRAAQAYESAHQDRKNAMPARQAEVLERAYRETALAYLQQQRHPALRDLLFQWEADFPTAKLGGELPLLLGRYFQAVGNHRRAVIEYESLLKVSPLHHARPEIAFRLAESLTTLNRHDDTERWYRTILLDYPNSTFAEKAADVVGIPESW
ncbi:MAG: hypothetical protein CMJ49_10745 [Planctomycetaceae bacterium]|nr:hypothetical protein [Planctomycetaceae bacterium]